MHKWHLFTYYPSKSILLLHSFVDWPNLYSKGFLHFCQAGQIFAQNQVDWHVTTIWWNRLAVQNVNCVALIETNTILRWFLRKTKYKIQWYRHHDNDCDDLPSKKQLVGAFYPFMLVTCWWSWFLAKICLDWQKCIKNPCDKNFMLLTTWRVHTASQLMGAF